MQRWFIQPVMKFGILVEESCADEISIEFLFQRFTEKRSFDRHNDKFESVQWFFVFSWRKHRFSSINEFVRLDRWNAKKFQQKQFIARPIGTDFCSSFESNSTRRRFRNCETIKMLFRIVFILAGKIFEVKHFLWLSLSLTETRLFHYPCRQKLQRIDVPHFFSRWKIRKLLTYEKHTFSFLRRSFTEKPKHFFVSLTKQSRKSFSPDFSEIKLAETRFQKNSDYSRM